MVIIDEAMYKIIANYLKQQNTFEGLFALDLSLVILPSFYSLYYEFPPINHA
jgi:hypothetical protein